MGGMGGGGLGGLGGMGGFGAGRPDPAMMQQMLQNPAAMEMMTYVIACHVYIII
jgi:hypothetical protein